jgi:hypothetical protein
MGVHFAIQRCKVGIYTLELGTMGDGMTEEPGWPIHKLWEKYEDIAMHFNDLIIKLRTSALAGVAALSTLVGVFAKSDPGHFGYTWEIAGCVFTALSAFWIAIWILDFSYYNKLLIGAVAALVELEKASATQKRISQIKLSTLVEKSVSSKVHFDLTLRERWNIVWGRWAFYLIVLGALVAGVLFSYHEHLTAILPVLSHSIGEMI